MGSLHNPEHSRPRVAIPVTNAALVSPTGLTSTALSQHRTSLARTRCSFLPKDSYDCPGVSMSSPGKRAMMKLKRVLRYLRGTTNLHITYKNGKDDDNDRLVGYVDADHAGDPDEGYSTTGYVFYFAGGPLYWKSQRQTIVTLSTVEAEYVALSKGGQECVYLRDLMSSAGFERAQATTMHEDNSGALKLANTDHYHPRTKHWCQVSLHQAPRQGERSCCGENIYG